MCTKFSWSLSLNKHRFDSQTMISNIRRALIGMSVMIINCQMDTIFCKNSLLMMTVSMISLISWIDLRSVSLIRSCPTDWKEQTTTHGLVLIYLDQRWLMTGMFFYGWCFLLMIIIVPSVSIVLSYRSTIVFFWMRHEGNIRERSVFLFSLWFDIECLLMISGFCTWFNYIQVYWFILRMIEWK